MVSPRSLRGDHWTLSSGMLKYRFEDGIGLAVIIQDVPIAPCFIASCSLGDNEIPAKAVPYL